MCYSKSVLDYGIKLPRLTWVLTINTLHINTIMAVNESLGKTPTPQFLWVYAEWAWALFELRKLSPGKLESHKSGCLPTQAFFHQAWNQAFISLRLGLDQVHPSFSASLNLRPGHPSPTSGSFYLLSGIWGPLRARFGGRERDRKFSGKVCKIFLPAKSK